MEDPVSLFGIDDNIHLIRATVKIIYWKFEEMRTNITKDASRRKTSFLHLARIHVISLSVEKSIETSSATISSIHCRDINARRSTFTRRISDWSFVRISFEVCSLSLLGDRWRRDRGGLRNPWSQWKTFDKSLDKDLPPLHTHIFIMTIGVESLTLQMS